MVARSTVKSLERGKTCLTALSNNTDSVQGGWSRHGICHIACTTRICDQTTQSCTQNEISDTESKTYLIHTAYIYMSKLHLLSVMCFSSFILVCVCRAVCVFAAHVWCSQARDHVWCAMYIQLVSTVQWAVRSVCVMLNNEHLCDDDDFSLLQPKACFTSELVLLASTFNPNGSLSSTKENNTTNK